MATDTIGNVALRVVDFSGLLTDAIGVREQLVVGGWGKEDREDLNALAFGGGQCQRKEPPAQYRDAVKRMEDEAGVTLDPHTCQLHVDTWTRGQQWGPELARLVDWPEKGTRVYPGPHLWARGVDFTKGAPMGAIASPGLNPIQTPGIDGTPGLTTFVTCAHRMSPLRRVIQLEWRFVRVALVDDKYPLALRTMFGERFVRAGGQWGSSRYLPNGLYSIWQVTLTDLATNTHESVQFLFAGYVPTLHGSQPWFLGTEHWVPGGGGNPMVLVVRNIEILREGRTSWEPAPRVHYYGQMEQPNHKVYAGNNAVVVSTEPVALPEVTVGQIIDPRRAA